MMGYALTYSVSILLILLYRMCCVGAVINPKRPLTRVEEILLQEYRMQIARKMTAVESSRDFLRIFVPNNEIEPRFTAMVNETVQKKKGRFFNQGRALQFDQEISDQAWQTWLAHGASVDCSEPQPLLLDMFEELNKHRGVGTYIYPSCTWVRRCAGSGCCPSDLQQCASVPGTRINVTKPFVTITEVDIANGHVIYEDKFLNYTFYEDTQCACRNRPEGELPCMRTACPANQGFSVANCACKCLKDCPSPYVQDPETCRCDCSSGDRACLKVMRGKTRLPASECLCVGHGCEVPKCRRHWSFSTSRCRCEVRAPPPGRARFHSSRAENEVPVEPEGEIIHEYTSGMTPPLTSMEATTIVLPLGPEEEEDNSGEDSNQSSSSSSPDETPSPDKLGPLDPLVGLPVAPEQRYTGGSGYHKGGQHNTRTKAVNTSQTFDSTAKEGLEEKAKIKEGIGLPVDEMTTFLNDDDSVTTMMTTNSEIFGRYRGRFGGGSRVGLDDDEDERDIDGAEFGSGSTPMDDDD